MTTTVLAVALAALAGYNGFQWIVKKGNKIEDRRRGAARLAGVLSGLGLKKTPEFLIDYSVGDYSGMALKIQQLVELFASGEVAVLAEFDEVCDSALAARLKTEAGRTYVAAKLADAVQVGDPAVVKEAPVPIVIP